MNNKEFNIDDVDAVEVLESLHYLLIAYVKYIDKICHCDEYNMHVCPYCYAIRTLNRYNFKNLDDNLLLEVCYLSGDCLATDELNILSNRVREEFNKREKEENNND